MSRNAHMILVSFVSQHVLRFNILTRSDSLTENTEFRPVFSQFILNQFTEPLPRFRQKFSNTMIHEIIITRVADLSEFIESVIKTVFSLKIRVNKRSELKKKNKKLKKMKSCFFRCKLARNHSCRQFF